MKKFIYIILLSVSISITMFSCTEEEITPIENTGGSPGGHQDPGKL